MELPQTDVVVGIGTGGIVPASLVAYELEAELKVLTLNYRDEKNTPQHESPVFISQTEELNLDGKRALLIDDVSVSGKTLDAAKKYLKGGEIKTLTLKGNADYVLFPEIKDCVKWPWKSYNQLKVKP